MEQQLPSSIEVVLPEQANPFYSEEDRRDLVRIAAFIAGDDSAFLELYARYEAPLLHYCRKMCSDHRVAEDSFQESWTRIFELRAKQGTVTHFQPLLFKTARNICLNALRREWVRNKGTVELDSVEVSGPADTTNDDSELRALLSRALGKLPIDQREVFVLHEYCSFTYVEIATILGKTPSNVKTTAFRARTRLRKVISSWLGLEEDDSPTEHFPFLQR